MFESVLLRVRFYYCLRLCWRKVPRWLGKGLDEATHVSKLAGLEGAELCRASPVPGRCRKVGRDLSAMIFWGVRGGCVLHRVLTQVGGWERIGGRRIIISGELR
jgi:hypothetical protein